MRRIKIPLIILITLMVINVFFMVPAWASDGEDDNVDDNTKSKIETLYNYIKNMKFDENTNYNINPDEFVENIKKSGEDKYSFNYIVDKVKNIAFKELGSALKSMALVLVIGIICALLKNLQSAFNNDQLSNIAFLACYALMIILISKSFIMALEMVKGTISTITNFMAALVPVLITLILSVGGITEAATMDPIVLGAVNVAPRIYIDLIIPLILAGFVLQFINNISSDYKISRLTKLINKIALWSQGILMTIFIGIVTVRGISSKTLDAVTAKTAKYAVDNFIPFVGKALSDAVSAVAGYSLILKNSISTLGVVVILIIILAPIIKIFLISMIYKLTAALLEPVSDSRLVSSLTSAGDSLLLIMSCLISVSIMFFILLCIMASTGKFIIGV